MAVAFYVDALSYLFVIAALGLRYALHAPDLRRVLLRAAAFFVFASAYWALLPLIARRKLGGSAGYYGIVLASIGAGAVAGAVLLPKWRTRISAGMTLRAGTALTAAVLVALAPLRHQALAVVVLALAGAAWISVLTTADTAAQALPHWVRGRGLAIFLTVFFGAMTARSLIWGQLADSLGVRRAACGPRSAWPLPWGSYLCSLRGSRRSPTPSAT